MKQMPPYPEELQDEAAELDRKVQDWAELVETMRELGALFAVAILICFAAMMFAGIARGCL